MMAALRRAFVLLLGGAAIVVFTMAFRQKQSTEARVVYVTLGEVQAIHAGVRIGDKEVRGVKRLRAGDRLTTSKDGRARARLDDGTSIVLDRATAVVVGEHGVALEAGRVFAQGAPGAHSQVDAGELSIAVGTSTVAIARTGEAEAYCVSGEAIARAASKELRVHSGELVRAPGGSLASTPAKVWNDWTSGMARPWSAAGTPRGAIGELWGRISNVDDVGAPLATRSHDVNVTIKGEVATTETRTTYFNAGSAPVVGDFRMAIPRGAIVSGFAVGTGDTLEPADVRLGTDGPGYQGAARLEWAGEGWVRGTTHLIQPAQTAVVVVRYVEWLSPAGAHMTYRYPMLGDGDPPVVGELHARIQLDVDATAIGVPPDAQVEGDTLELRRADFRPTADLVVDMDLRPGAFDRARAYFVPGPEGAGGSFLLVRTDTTPVPETRGTTLAVLVDTSRSIDATALDAERAVVNALLDGLGEGDRVVVFRGDDRVTPVGPEGLGPVDDARRTAIRTGLDALRPGGATDLGATLERVADALPADDPSAMVLYLGDGWPTLGDEGVDAIRARLARRHGGAPRIGAVAVGPAPNRFGLTALARSSGPVFEARDRGAAAEVAVHLLANALEPRAEAASIDLGPDVERVYPRAHEAARTGDTLTAVGRLLGSPPRSIDVVSEDASGEKRERRTLTVVPVVDEGDVRRRWSAARVEELMLRGGGSEAVVDAALANELLTPWTGWAVGLTPGTSYHATPLWSRVLDDGLDGNLAVFSASFATSHRPRGALRVPDDEPWPKASSPGEHDAWKLAEEDAARRTLEGSRDAALQCRESRAALRPEVGGALHVEVSLGSSGIVEHVRATGGSALDDDPAVDRCVEDVVRSATFFASGDTHITLTYDFHFPPAQDGRARRCSPTAALAAPMRRGVWFERLQRPDSPTNPVGTRGERAYFHAKAACELPRWADRRSFLELLLSQAPNGPAEVDLAHMLDLGGDTDAAAFVRREAVRRASTPIELEAIRRAILANEPDVLLPFVTAYDKVDTNEARLQVVQRFLALAPHESRLRRKELTLLQALDRRDDLREATKAAREEPFLDATLLADAASALFHLGAKDEARRAFGELAERAPEVPFARAFLGDRLLDEGLFDEATTAYDALVQLVPDDPAASFRLALANAGAGRLDLASRTLTHVVETGGRTSDPVLEDLAAMTEAMLIAEARAAHASDGEAHDLARLTSPWPTGDDTGLVLARAPTWALGFDMAVLRGKGTDDADALPVTRAPSLGIAGAHLARGEGALVFRLRRQRDLEPARTATARLEVLTVDANTIPKWVEKDVPLRADGTGTDVTWDGSSFH